MISGCLFLLASSCVWRKETMFGDSSDPIDPEWSSLASLSFFFLISSDSDRWCCPLLFLFFSFFSFFSLIFLSS